MNNGYTNVTEETQGYEPLLPIGKPIVFERECRALKNARGIDKIEPVVPEVLTPLALIPAEAHFQIQNVYT